MTKQFYLQFLLFSCAFRIVDGGTLAPRLAEWNVIDFIATVLITYQTGNYMPAKSYFAN